MQKVKQNLKREEMLDFVSIKYPMYAWSFRTLCQHFRYFDILKVYRLNLNKNKFIK